MSETLWGVLVGALIALAGQLTTAFMTARTERAKWLRERRIDAYRKAANAWRHEIKRLSDMDAWNDYRGIPDLEPDHFMNLVDAFDDMELVASPRTVQAAWSAYRELLTINSVPSSKEGETLRRADARFRTFQGLTRADLGLGKELPDPFSD